MIDKLKLVIYYLIVARLPHSRFGMWFNTVRVWYVSKVMKIMIYDRKSYFENGVYFADGKRISIGKHCHINEHAFIQAARIGDYVMIAPYAAILSRSHAHGSVDVPMITQGEEEERAPVLGNDIWIGRNAVIMPGVRIGDGSIIAAGAVVVNDVEPRSVIGGVPGRLLRKRTNEQ